MGRAGPGQATLTRPDPTRPDPTRKHPWNSGCRHEKKIIFKEQIETAKPSCYTYAAKDVRSKSILFVPQSEGALLKAWSWPAIHVFPFICFCLVFELANSWRSSLVPRPLSPFTWLGACSVSFAFRARCRCMYVLCVSCVISGKHLGPLPLACGLDRHIAVQV